MISHSQSQPRILILSCNTGQGHNSCAKAIEEVCAAEGTFCRTEDALAFIAPWVSRLICGGHVTIYRHFPRLFRVGYRFTEKHPGLFHQSPTLFRILKGSIERLYRFIVDGGYQAVICTHVFAGLMLTSLLERHPLPIATSFLSTDYTCSPGVADTRLDRYYLPDETLTGKFETPVISRDRMVCCGIPVRQAFYRRTAREEAKRAAGLNPAGRHLLVMCGSMGCGPLTELTDRLARELPDGCEMTVVCGTNRRLRARLERAHSECPRLHIRGFVEDVSLLMDSADLYLTKPGGISVSEAAVKDLPMVFVNAVAGCEEYNLRFFLELGGAAAADTPKDLAALCLSLLTDDTRRRRMSEALQRRDKPNAARRIYACTREDIEARQSAAR